MKTIAIIAKPHGEMVREIVNKVLLYLDRADRDVLFDKRTADVLGRTDYAGDSEIKEKADLIVVLGGDGTLISAVRILEEKETPIMGVNLGRLGFLTENKSEDVIDTLSQVLNGNYRIERRMKLHSHLMVDGEKSIEIDVLNDITINKSDLARIIDIELIIDGQYVNNYRADGIIFATPTGSTAYNMAAGGPIVHPGLHSIIVTPICPHALTNKPLVISDESEICVRILNEDENVSITYDGQVSEKIDPSKLIIIKKASSITNLIVPTDKNYYMLLREKLGWGRS